MPKSIIERVKLKKQSQYATEQFDISSYLKGYYDNIKFVGVAENKANLSLREQSQYDMEAKPAQTIPIPIYDNRNEAATRSMFEKTNPIL